MLLYNCFIYKYKNKYTIFIMTTPMSSMFKKVSLCNCYPRRILTTAIGLFPRYLYLIASILTCLQYPI